MLNNFITVFKEESNFDKVIYLIVFLLPLFSISIRHWVSGIFILLFLLSIVSYFRIKNKTRSLGKEEKYYIYILLLYFVVFLLSSVVNGWGEPQTHIFGTMLRFITFIPVFLMFRNLKYLLPVLVVGSILACVFNIIYLYDNPGKGVYSHLFSGPMTFLFCIFIVPVIVNYRMNNIIKIILGIIMLMSILTVFELGSRSAFIAILLIMIFYSIIFVKGINRVYGAVVIILLSVGTYYGNDNVKTRIDRISHGVTVYFNEKDPIKATAKLNSVHDIAARLEMWRAGKYFILKDPVLGFGPNEFKNEIKILIDKKLISSVAFASHPHNAYLHELFAKGFLGLIIMLLVLYYPAYLFIIYFKSNSYISMIGLSIIISITSYSLTESAAFNNNNFIAIMLIYISIPFMTLFQNNTSIYRSDELRK